MGLNAYKDNLRSIDWSIKAKNPKKVKREHGVKRANFPTPRIAGDYTPYECPVTGKQIEGRKAHEENLKRTGCRLLEPGEKEDNIQNAARAVDEEDKRRGAVIDGIVDSVANEYFS